MVRLPAAQGRADAVDAVAGPLQNQVSVQLGGRAPPVPELGAADVVAEELFLLCTDGFWESVEPREVAACLAEHPLANGAAEYLVARARERGGAAGDNISIVLAQWRGERRGGLWSGLLRGRGRAVGGR